MRLAWIALLSLSANAWMLPEGAPMCTSKSALDSYEIQQSGEPVSEIELIQIRNDCDLTHPTAKVNPHFMGVYSKVQAVNYKDERKVYFVVTRDLIKD